MLQKKTEAFATAFGDFYLLALALLPHSCLIGVAECRLIFFLPEVMIASPQVMSQQQNAGFEHYLKFFPPLPVYP